MKLTMRSSMPAATINTTSKKLKLFRGLPSEYFAGFNVFPFSPCGVTETMSDESGEFADHGVKDTLECRRRRTVRERALYDYNNQLKHNQHRQNNH